MHSDQENTQRPACGNLRLAAAAIIFMFTAVACAGTVAKDSTGQQEFATPEAAVEALAAAAKTDDEQGLESIFGPAAKELISSGDPVADRLQRKKFSADFDLKNRLTREGERWILTIGQQDWPFPIPLVKREAGWAFDTKAGREEILFRRIGGNELDTVQTLLAIVDAQREYAMGDRSGDGIREYAQKFRSDPGTTDGLFWETRPGEAPSPLGQLVADARAEGYSMSGRQQGPMPYHGYYYRMLTAQGPHAAGGAFDYLVNGRQIGGFAVLAYPATYGNSGVMTFMVNHDGTVYESDLGEGTAERALAMKAFDPDDTWQPLQ